MAVPEISIVDHPAGYRIIAFEIPGGICTPEEFAQALARLDDETTGDKPVLLTGRGPVWGYGMLVHAAHPTPAVATYEPRLAGYVVVASHDPRLRVGEVIADPEARS